MPNGFSQSGATIRVSGITHQSMSAIEAEADSGRVRPPEWNDDHVVTGGYHGQYMMRDTTAAVGWSFAGAGSAYIGCQAPKTTVQSLAGSTWTPVRFTDTDSWDTDNLHDPSTNNGERFVVPAGMSGKWMVVTRVQFAASSSNTRYLRFIKNGSQIQGNMPSFTPTSTAAATIHAATQLDLVAGDYVGVEAYQDITGGGALNITGVFDFYKLDSGKVGQGIGARVTNTAATSIGISTPTAVPFATEDFDTDSFHDTSSNNTRLVIPAGLGGHYIIVGQVTFNASNLSGVYGLIRKNNTSDVAFFGRYGGEASVSSGFNGSAILSLVPGDYVELIVNQGSGSNQPLEATAGYNSFSLMRLDSGSQTNSVRFPTVLQRANNEAAATTTIAVTIAAAGAGQRIILGSWSTVGDITAVSCTNVTWTQMANGNFSTTIYADIWVGVVTATSGTTITVTKGSSGGFMGVAVAVVNDLLTPTAVTGVGTSGADVRNMATTLSNLEAQTHVGKMFAGFAGLNDGTDPVSIMVNQPYLTVYSNRFPLVIGYVSTGGTLVSWCMGGSSSADFVNDLVIIS